VLAENKVGHENDEIVTQGHSRSSILQSIGLTVLRVRQRLLIGIEYRWPYLYSIVYEEVVTENVENLHCRQPQYHLTSPPEEVNSREYPHLPYICRN